jgi:hypothetical protein
MLKICEDSLVKGFKTFPLPRLGTPVSSYEWYDNMSSSRLIAFAAFFQMQLEMRTLPAPSGLLEIERDAGLRKHSGTSDAVGSLKTQLLCLCSGVSPFFLFPMTPRPVSQHGFSFLTNYSDFFPVI